MCGSRGGGGGAGGPDPPPLKNHRSIGFLCNTGPDPLNNHKATKPAFNVGPEPHSRMTSLTTSSNLAKRCLIKQIVGEPEIQKLEKSGRKVAEF